MRTLEEVLRNLKKTTKVETLVESQSQEIAKEYKRLSNLYGVNLDDLVYGPRGFMNLFYPGGGLNADIIFLEDKWEEFERWVKRTKGIDFKAIRAKQHVNPIIERAMSKTSGVMIWTEGDTTEYHAEWINIPADITLSKFKILLLDNGYEIHDYSAADKAWWDEEDEGVKFCIELVSAARWWRFSSLRDCMNWFKAGNTNTFKNSNNYYALDQKITEPLSEASKLSYGELSWKMGEVISAMNNEDAYFDSGWLYIWPDEQTEEECLENFGDKESYDDLKALFKEIYTEYHEDGLYTDKQHIVDFAHEMDKKFRLSPIENFMNIKESVDNDNNDNNNYALQVSVESGLSADGVDISVFQDDKLTLKKSYRYGYDASYGKFNDPDRPYVGNIIQDYISKYNITEDNFNVIAGKNVYRGEKVSNKDVEDFKTKYCSNLVFNDSVAKDVKATELIETAENNFISIPRSSREFDNVIEKYYKNFGKHLQIDTMLYDNQSGKYYMYNDQTDYSLTTKRLTESALAEEIIEETYTEEELDDMVGKIYNLQKITKIFRRKKYDDKRLFAHTVCTKCGREKNIFLSNLVNDPAKYGSCICSDTNIEAKIDNIRQLYTGKKKLKNNTSGYTGVSFVKTYKGEPYNKWRAYIEVDGVRTYLGDFKSKAEAIKARKDAGEKGVKWYLDNQNKIMRDVRRKTKKYKTSKYRETQKTRTYAKVK